jgi:hypothetical protein
MLMAAVILDILAAAGLSALAAKYFFGPAPADYHGNMLTAGGTDIDDTMRLVFAAINRAFGGALFALSLTIAALAVFGVTADMMWAKVVIVLAALLAGVPAASVAYAAEKKTGQKTPWRAAAVLVAIAVVAFVISLL